MEVLKFSYFTHPPTMNSKYFFSVLVIYVKQTAFGYKRFQDGLIDGHMPPA